MQGPNRQGISPCPVGSQVHGYTNACEHFRRSPGRQCVVYVGDLSVMNVKVMGSFRQFLATVYP